MKLNKTLIASVALVMTGLAACHDDDTTVIEYGAPVQVTRAEFDGLTDVAPWATDIRVNFNCDVKPAHVAKILVNNTVPDSVSATGSELLIYVAAGLMPDTEYTVALYPFSVTAADESKHSFLEEPFKFSFSTAKEFVFRKDNVAVAPVNANATEPARKIYTLLYDNYGQNTMSGAMGGVGWESGYADFIAKKAGEYPAVVGFDYLHLSASPSNWIDYGDISCVRNAWDAGSIPAFTWHWNVPVAEGVTDISYSTGNTTFRASNIFVDGTWEQRVAEADIAKVAGYLKLLQDAGIAVIWRPLHEAAGDYTWGAWFWWGAEGPEVTKQLYLYLYDQLTNRYGLNNLIWEWTIQLSDAGQLTWDWSKIMASYPGDDYVDLVGYDSYEPTTGVDVTQQFRILAGATSQHKMLALAEIGNLIDFNASVANQSVWAYFMHWYSMNQYGEWSLDSDSWNNTRKLWRETVALPFILNRGDFAL